MEQTLQVGASRGPLLAEQDRVAQDPAGDAIGVAQELVRQGHLQKATAILEAELRMSPQLTRAWAMLAFVRLEMGQTEVALAAIERVVAQVPEDARGWNNRALILGGLRRDVDSLASIDRALDLDPQNPHYWWNRSRLLAESRRYVEALASADRALAIAPRMAELFGARASILCALGRWEQALATCEEGTRIDPDCANVLVNHGWALAALGHPMQGVESLNRALDLVPGHPQARFYRGMLRLSLGQFAQGWEDYEARDLVTRVSDNRVNREKVWHPTESIAGKTILLHFEQGFGDIIHFSRFAPVLARLGANVVFTVPPQLYRLLGSLDPGVQLITQGDAIPTFDLECWLLGVPRRLGIAEETIPASVPYLRAPEEDLRRWRFKLGLPGEGNRARARLRLGLVYGGSAGYVTDRQRSIALEQFSEHIFRLPKGACEWHLMQTDVREHDEPWLARLGIIDHRSELQDFCETAALASCMDAIVSVDTSPAHLAGALGLPLYLLLPAFADWRWMRDRSDSPWYPTARLFRQRRLGAWDEPLEEVFGCLQRLCDARASAIGRG